MTTRKQPIPGIAVSAHVVTPARIPKFTLNCATVVVEDGSAEILGGIGNATAPASDFANGRIVWQTEGSSLVKIIPLAIRDGGGNTATGLKMRVYGWSRDQSLTPAGNATVSQRFWWPTMLFAADLTRAATGFTPWGNTDNVNGAWGLISTIAKTHGDGKIFNAPTGDAGGACVVIDTLGCQMFDIRFSATSKTGTITANAIWQSL